MFPYPNVQFFVVRVVGRVEILAVLFTLIGWNLLALANDHELWDCWRVFELMFYWNPPVVMALSAAIVP